MIRMVPHPRPPRLAAWLVGLFAPGEKSESILGDLQEEFSDLASKSGVESSRRWYWRQAAKTILHLAGAAFRVAPWSLAGAVLLGFALRKLGLGLFERIIGAVLHTQRYHLYWWLATWAIPSAWIVEMTLIGCAVAAVAKRREILATLVLITASVIVFCFVFFPWMRSLPPQTPFPWTVLLRNVEDWTAIFLGSILIRGIRSASLRRHPTP